jgi:hypothetical protein
MKREPGSRDIIGDIKLDSLYMSKEGGGKAL